MSTSTGYDHVSYWQPGAEQPVWGLSVTGLGRTRISPGADYPPYRHLHRERAFGRGGRQIERWQCVLISDGRGHIRFAGEAGQEIAAPAVFWLRPGCWHRYQPDPRVGWHEHWVEFAGAHALHVDEHHLRDAPGVWPLPAPGPLAARFDAMIDDARAGQPYLREQLATACSRLLVELLSLERRRLVAARPDGDAIERARLLLDERCCEPLDMPAVAAAAGLSYHAFRRHFPAVAGCAPKTYLMRRRLDRALVLLRSGAGLDEVAAACGFASASYLARCCRRHLGLAPSALRRG